MTRNRTIEKADIDKKERNTKGQRRIKWPQIINGKENKKRLTKSCK